MLKGIAIRMVRRQLIFMETSTKVPQAQLENFCLHCKNESKIRNYFMSTLVKNGLK